MDEVDAAREQKKELDDRIESLKKHLSQTLIEHVLLEINYEDQNRKYATHMKYMKDACKIKDDRNDDYNRQIDKLKVFWALHSTHMSVPC